MRKYKVTGISQLTSGTHAASLRIYSGCQILTREDQGIRSDSKRCGSGVVVVFSEASDLISGASGQD